MNSKSWSAKTHWFPASQALSAILSPQVRFLSQLWDIPTSTLHTVKKNLRNNQQHTGENDWGSCSKKHLKTPLWQWHVMLKRLAKRSLDSSIASQNPGLNARQKLQKFTKPPICILLQNKKNSNNNGVQHNVKCVCSFQSFQFQLISIASFFTRSQDGKVLTIVAWSCISAISPSNSNASGHGALWQLSMA